jgi:uncharacterized protein with GYD domain
MALFMLQVSYTSESWAAQIKHPQDRREAFGALVKKFGGTLKDAYLALGDEDVVAIYEAPDATAAAAIGMAVAAPGHCKAVKTTALVSIEDGLAAMRRAAEVSYAAPR